MVRTEYRVMIKRSNSSLHGFDPRMFAHQMGCVPQDYFTHCKIQYMFMLFKYNINRNEIKVRQPLTILVVLLYGNVSYYTPQSIHWFPTVHMDARCTPVTGCAPCWCSDGPGHRFPRHPHTATVCTACLHHTSWSTGKSNINISYTNLTAFLLFFTIVRHKTL